MQPRPHKGTEQLNPAQPDEQLQLLDAMQAPFTQPVLHTGSVVVVVVVVDVVVVIVVVARKNK